MRSDSSLPALDPAMNSGRQPSTKLTAAEASKHVGVRPATKPGATGARRRCGSSQTARHKRHRWAPHPSGHQKLTASCWKVRVAQRRHAGTLPVAHVVMRRLLRSRRAIITHSSCQLSHDNNNAHNAHDLNTTNSASLQSTQPSKRQQPADKPTNATLTSSHYVLTVCLLLVSSSWTC